MESNTGTMLNISGLYNCFQRLTDQRQARGKRYALETILLGIFLAKFCGETGCPVVISMDGKIIRGTIDVEVNKGLCLLAVYLPG